MVAPGKEKLKTSCQNAVEILPVFFLKNGIIVSTDLEEKDPEACPHSTTKH
jgi:hypothetical protein